MKKNINVKSPIKTKSNKVESSSDSETSSSDLTSDSSSDSDVKSKVSKSSKTPELSPKKRDKTDKVKPVEENKVDDSKVKRSVGRPPKQRPNLANKIREGICDEPKIADNVIEFEFDHPQMFKLLLTYLKKMLANSIIFEFKSDRIILKAAGHSDINSTMIVFKAEYAIRYYCKEDFKFAISRSVLESNFKHINNSPTNMFIYVSKSERKERIHIIFQKFDPACKSDNSIEIQELAHISDPFTKDVDPSTIDLDDYPLRFTMTYATINDHIGSSSADILQISKYENQPLTFRFNSNSQANDTIEQFTDPKSINLRFMEVFKDSRSEKSNRSDNSEKSDDSDSNTNYIKIDILISSLTHIVKTKLGDRINFYIDDDGKLLTVIECGDIIIDRNKLKSITVYNYTCRR